MPRRCAATGSAPTCTSAGLVGRVTLSVDAAGEPLHRRGWRARIGAAPLRETLAAALLRVAGWSGDRPFLDPHVRLGHAGHRGGAHGGAARPRPRPDLRLRALPRPRRPPHRPAARAAPRRGPAGHRPHPRLRPEHGGAAPGPEERRRGRRRGGGALRAGRRRHRGPAARGGRGLRRQPALRREARRGRGRRLALARPAGAAPPRLDAGGARSRPGPGAAAAASPAARPSPSATAGWPARC